MQENEKKKVINENYIPSLDIVKKSSNLINAFQNATLLSQKILLVGLCKIENRDEKKFSLAELERYKKIEEQMGTDFSKGLVAEIKNCELRNAIGNKSGSYYDSIRILMSPNKTDPRTLRNNLVFVAPKESGLLGHTELLTGTAYDSENGCLLLKFNNEESVKKEVWSLSKNFASLPRDFMLRTKSVYAFRVYELIQSRVQLEDYFCNKAKKPLKNEFTFTFEFGEIKFLLGMLDVKLSEKIKDRLFKNKKVNYNAMAEEFVNETGSGKSVSSYGDIKRYVFNVAEKEINSNPESEYKIKFEPIRNGPGGKVVNVNLYVTRINNVYDEDSNEDISPAKNELSEEKKYDFIDAIKNICPPDLKIKELMILAEDSGFNIEKIKDAVEALENTTKEVPNKVGYMRSIIQNGYNKPKKKASTTKKKEVDYMQQDYDFDDLEKKLLNEGNS